MTIGSNKKYFFLVNLYSVALLHFQIASQNYQHSRVFRQHIGVSKSEAHFLKKREIIAKSVATNSEHFPCLEEKKTTLPQHFPKNDAVVYFTAKKEKNKLPTHYPM
mmetsp:Transcript_1950/g.2664  ORF Transcript_1950/g.2664 Transcript_1950/m.2664 type:complete len:106 (+) Transcript_1950:4596-4913(+)